MRREGPGRIACLLGVAGAASAEVAREFSPWVELGGDGAVFFDVRGCDALHGGEAGLATAVAERAGAGARLGIAGSKAAARLAADHGLGVVPPGGDREALAPLPVAALRPAPEAAEALRRWGVERLGQLAALPRGEVVLRLGAAGARLWDVAAGADDEPLVPTPSPDEPEEDVDLEYPIAEVEPLVFVLRGALDRLAVRLAARGTAFGAVLLRLRLDAASMPPADEAERGAEADERWLSLAAPLRDVPAILALLRVSIESRPPAAPVAGLRVRAVPAAGRPGQLALFEPAGPSPQKLAVALARLAALVGPARVGTPVVPDEHRSAAPLPLRVLRPPRAASWGPGSRLVSDDPRLCGVPLRLSGPWKLRGGWWSDAPLERDYYDAELSSGALIRLYRDARTDEWFLDGVYD